MDSILSCMTAGHNIYTINRERKQLFLTHPQLVPHLYKKTTIDSQSDYYARKAAYLAKHGYTEGLNHQYDGTITPAIKSEGFLCHSRPCGLARKGTESGPGSRAANGFERFHPDGDKNS